MNVNLDKIAFNKETLLTIRGTRRRTTVQKDIVDQIDMKNGDNLRWCLLKDNTIIITKIQGGD